MTDAPTYLDKILAAKRARLREVGRVDGRAGVVTDAELDALARSRPCRDFAAALTTGAWPRVIAEFKRASPSLGPIREDADVAHVSSVASKYSSIANRTRARAR